MEFIFEKESDKDFSTAVNDLKTCLQRKSFGVLWELNLKDKLQEKGQDFNTNFMVLEVCNPAKAALVLNQRIEAGFMLPCKMGVYEKNGKTWVGMQNPIKLVEVMGDESLRGFAEEVAETLRSAIEETI